MDKKQRRCGAQRFEVLQNYFHCMCQLMLYVDCSLLCSTALSKLGASTAMVQCIAKKWDGHRCSLQAKPGHRLCGNHLKGTRYGLIELPGPEEVQHEEPLEGQQQREGEQHQEVPQEEQQAGGDAEGIPEDDGRIPEQQMLQEESGKLDIDMFLLPVSLETVASISNFWVSTHTPPLKLFSERPGFLQLFHHPMAMFLELPHNCEVQDFKAKVCQLLYDSGVEIPLPTSHPLLNHYNGGCVSKRSLRVHWGTVRPALVELGIVQVYLGQFGCKCPLPEFLDSFAEPMGADMNEATAFDLAWQAKDASHIWLFGLKAGKDKFASVMQEGSICKAYVHPILPGLVQPEDPVQWGTLEIRSEGRAGSEKGKVLQAYSPLSHLIKAAGEYETKQPTKMSGLRSRKAGIINLVDTISANINKAGGLRIEVRMRAGMGSSTCQEGLAQAKQILARVRGLMCDGTIKFKCIPVDFYLDFIQKELASAINKQVFAGMRNTGPDPNNQDQMQRFACKVQSWSFLLANIGLVSGHFARLIKNGVSCQDHPVRHVPAPMAAAPMPAAGMPQDATAAEEGAEEEDLEEDAEPRTAPSRHEVDQDAPATHQEKVLMEQISFQIKRTRDHNEWIVFKYLPGWGPEHSKLKISGYYPSKHVACRAILEWAGDDWNRRVALKANSLALVPAQSQQLEATAKEARISSSIRKMRSDYLEHLAKFLPQAEVANDPAGQLLGQLVEDDHLSLALGRCATESSMCGKRPSRWS